MGFRDLVKRDMQKVFMNTSEFAAVHTINGEEIVCDVNQDDSQDIHVGDSTIDIEEVYTDRKIIYMPVDAMETPAIGQELVLDGTRYKVVNVEVDLAKLSISIAGNRQ